MPDSRNTELVEINLAWLRQVLDLVGHLDDAAFACAPAALPGHRVGSHLRHILEFYDCFLDGVRTMRIDYDARNRDRAVEHNRSLAEARIRLLMARLGNNLRVREDCVLVVRMEDAPENSFDPWLHTTVCRELQALSSHTIHHFALIAVTLTAHGVPVDPEFGMSPSTLRFKHAQQDFAAEAA
jgi:hypothetical protein